MKSQFLKTLAPHVKNASFTKALSLFVVLFALMSTTVIAVVLSTQSTQLSSRASTATTIPVSEDAFVSQSNPIKNYGADAYLKVDLEKKSFLKFDLTSLAGQGSQITNATLRLYVINDSNVSQTIKEVTDNSWTESTITFDNQPQSGLVVGQISSTVLNAWKDIDLTAFVAANAGNVVTLAIDTTGNNNLYVASKNSANPPVIVVQIADGAPIPTATETPISPTSILTPEPTLEVSPTPSTVPTTVPTSGGGAIRNVSVSTAAQLTAALLDSRPGDVITMADGIYKAKLKSSIPIGTTYYTASFIASQSGTAANPIVLQGSRNARIDGGGLGGYYGLYIIAANHVQVKGITVENGNKGIILDKSNNITLESVEVRDIHDEGVHIRGISKDVTVRDSYIHHIGKNKTTGVIDNHYGEGIYVGSANSSNWCTYSNCQPDASDRAQIIGNTIVSTGGESIDVKEGSSYGVIQNNTFNNQGINTKADSWVDIKGNNWLIDGNQGSYAVANGYEVHGVLTGWGNNNTFSNNTATNVGQYGFWFQNNVTGNKFLCTNTATNAPSGLANVTCVNQ